jgi:hypothetical protein
MDAFNFVFSLFGLLLGLSLAEVLSGFARALRHRRAVRLGWLIPLLAVFLMLDLTSFWAWAWGARSYIQPEYGYLLIGLIVSGLYYLAASIVFPAEFGNSHDFDAHYFEHRRQVLGAVVLCNLIGQGWIIFLSIPGLPVRVLVENGLFYALLATAFVTRSKAVSIVALALLIGLYLFAGAASFVQPVGG